MRVIAGSAKGKRIDTVEGLSTRPTLDRVREAIFGALQFSLKGANCLDLFSGSGAMGIEALSRGAESCCFVDVSADCVKQIKNNLINAGLKGRVMECSYDKAISSLEESFDYIFMDPPYASGFYQPAIDAVIEKRLLKQGGYIIVEHDGSLHVQGCLEEKRKKYGKAYVSWLTYEV